MNIMTKLIILASILVIPGTLCSPINQQEKRNTPVQTITLPATGAYVFEVSTSTPTPLTPYEALLKSNPECFKASTVDVDACDATLVQFNWQESADWVRKAIPSDCGSGVGQGTLDLHFSVVCMKTVEKFTEVEMITYVNGMLPEMCYHPFEDWTKKKTWDPTAFKACRKWKRRLVDMNLMYAMKLQEGLYP